MVDTLNNFSKVFAAGALNFASISPSDSTVLSGVRAFYIGTGGTIVATNAAGSDVTFSNVPDGALLQISASKIKAASTATNIVALY